ncbi:glycoside hydrolase family protein [Postechiella marina]|uniref:Glycoside hydrolase family protein n=1 Tax=Postechiella marina TaxID=943941 RepID=A0ABP8CAF5_9FLAO
MKILKFLFLIVFTNFALNINAQDLKRNRPQEWDGLIFGGRFIDRFSPIPKVGKLTGNTWGAQEVKPRYTDNGIEHKDWSYWGGNIKKGNDGKYHMFVCRWREDSEKGHMEWPRSEVIHAKSNQLIGPFKYVETIGQGHNPEIYKLKNGQYVISVNNGYYLSSSLNGPWEFKIFEYDQRNRPVFDHLTNNTYAQREDGSYLMVSRGGEISFSETGLPPFNQVNTKTVYPPYEGRYEDPVVWKTNIQYHLIVNDWLGRIAYYLRSKDGINWKTDTGEAYLPGIAKYEDKTLVNWYKFERMKIYQDEYGRAYQANFAVADTIKKQDKGSDNHSSKNIGIPLKKGKLLTVLNTSRINANTDFIRVKIKAEADFNPHKNINIKSLRFGASEEINFGRGSKIYKTEKSGNDLILIFHGKNNGLTHNNFAGKLLGKTKKGKLLFGYARLPEINYNQQALSSKFPTLSLNGKHLKTEIEVQNFGQISSKPSLLTIDYLKNDKWVEFAKDTVTTLKPFKKQTLTIHGKKFADRETPVKVKVTIKQKDQKDDVLEGFVIIR